MENRVYTLHGALAHLEVHESSMSIDASSATDEELAIYNEFLTALYECEHKLFCIQMQKSQI